MKRKTKVEVLTQISWDQNARSSPSGPNGKYFGTWSGQGKNSYWKAPLSNIEGFQLWEQKETKKKSSEKGDIRNLYGPVNIRP